MKWRRGLFRGWIVGSLIWAITVFFSQLPSQTSDVRVDDLIGRPWLPWRLQFVSYVEAFKHPTIQNHAPPWDWTVNTDMTASTALIVARCGDTIIAMVLPPVLVLLAVLWIARGFAQGPAEASSN